MRASSSITDTGGEGEAVAARGAASEGSTGAVAVSVWISSRQLVAANVLMLLPMLIRNWFAEITVMCLERL